MNRFLTWAREYNWAAISALVLGLAVVVVSALIVAGAIGLPWIALAGSFAWVALLLAVLALRR